MMLGWPNTMYHILTMGHSDLRLKVFSTGPSRAISCNVTSCPISKVWFRGTFAHTQHHVFPDTRDIYTKKWKIMCIYKYQCKYINIYIYIFRENIRHGWFRPWFTYLFNSHPVLSWSGSRRDIARAMLRQTIWWQLAAGATCDVDQTSAAHVMCHYVHSQQTSKRAHL